MRLVILTYFEAIVSFLEQPNKILPSRARTEVKRKRAGGLLCFLVNRLGDHIGGVLLNAIA